MNPLLLPLLAGGIVLFFASKAQAGKNIKAYLKGVKFSGKFPQTAFITFRIVNGASAGVVVNSIVGEVYINGKLVGDVNNVQNFTIPANSEVEYTVKLTPSSLGIIAIIYQLFTTKQKFVVEFKGTVNSTGALISIDQKITV